MRRWIRLAFPNPAAPRPVFRTFVFGSMHVRSTLLLRGLCLPVGRVPEVAYARHTDVETRIHFARTAPASSARWQILLGGANVNGEAVRDGPVQASVSSAKRPRSV